MSLLIVHVHVHVKPGAEQAFLAASRANAAASVQEPGIAQFEVHQQVDDPTRFVLIEGYRTPEAPAAHKATAHYAAWAEAVTPMLAKDRTRARFTEVYPPAAEW